MQQRPFFFEGDLIDLIRVPLQAQFSELLRLVRDGFVDPLLYFIPRSPMPTRAAPVVSWRRSASLLASSALA